MATICNTQDAMKDICDGMSVMVGGFLNVGTPENLVHALAKKNVKDLTLIANDGGYPGKGIGMLLDNGQLGKVHTSYVGSHPDYTKCMENGDVEINLIPQGTLAEQIRAAGSGLGGILTPTGVGTIAAKGKKEIVIDGRTYLLEHPLAADIALLKAYKADTSGNLVYRLSARNFNPLMAMAAKTVIVEVEEIVPVGTLDPDHIVTPGIFVDFIVKGEY